MNYKAHPTVYSDVQFRSRLEARWAAFFDLVDWTWEYEPIDLPGWTPDFRVGFRCSHTECCADFCSPKVNGSYPRNENHRHILLVEVKPYYHINEFEGHPCLDYPFGQSEKGTIPADASAAFGINPFVSYWEMCHGAGGGVYCVGDWVARGLKDEGKMAAAWKKAGNIVQWRGRRL